MAGQSDYREDVTWQEELRANARVVGMTVRASPLFALALLVGTALEGLVPALMVREVGRFVGVVQQAAALGSGSEAWDRAVRALVILGVAIAGSQVLKPIKGAVQFGLGRRFQAAFSRRVMQGVTSTPGIAHFEDPAFRDRLELSGWIDWAPAQTITMTGMIVQQLVTSISMAFVAAEFAGWVPAIMMATSLPAAVAAFHRVKHQGLALWQDTPELKRATYYRNLALELEGAKEIRVFGLRDWTVDRQDTHWLAGFRQAWRKRRVAAILVTWLRLLQVGGLVFVYLSMLNRALGGPGPAAARAGLFLSSSLAAAAIITSTVGAFQGAAWVRRINFMLPFAMRLFDLGARDPRLDTSGARTAHGLERAGIRFEGVRFRYPGTERWVLGGVDLAIPAGQSIALVGENGAGKTTLIKLLCRFYDPDQGRITLDGVDIREFDLADLRRRIACIFQDFTRYELPARANIGFGAVDSIGDDAMLAEAARRVGVLDEIKGLPQGWETPLSRAFEGVDLSGGQWQRVALARAIMAQLGRDADLLILDEPTASLDVRLEHELYEHFADLSRGRTTMLVSHRFSTVRMAERIVFLEEGRVVEDGSHGSLMALDGRYAALYRLQAEHYQRMGTLE